MTYPSSFTTLPDKEQILAAFKGKSVDELPTPSVVINGSKFEANSNKMLGNASRLEASFRAHIKTHKTLEGTRLQLGTGSITTDKIVVSTMMEAWHVLPLVKQGLIKDIHFSLPVVKSRLAELADLASQIPSLRIMLDNTEQLTILADFNRANPGTKKWSVFVKINMGTNRAGFLNDSEFLAETLDLALKDETVKLAVDIYGFYCHAGHSYASDTENKAKDMLLEEISAANYAASAAKKIEADLDLVISVGATPTAHASEILTMAEVESAVGGKLAGALELHAGNYPCCDLQQLSTGCIKEDDISLVLIAEVVSTYVNRGDKGPGEQLINAGVCALAREFGPVIGHGRIAEPKEYNNWVVGRLSQEHGILVALDDDAKLIPLGTKVKVIPQHSCITANAHPWFYIVDDEDKVVDIWVPARGW